MTLTPYQLFLSDPNRRNVWLVETTGRKIADGTTQAYYWSTAKYGTKAIDTPASQRYDARVLAGVSAKVDAIAPGTVGLLPVNQGIAVMLVQKLGDLDAIFAAYTFEGQDVTVKHGGKSRFGELAYADFGVVFSGVWTQVSPTLKTVELAAQEKTVLFDQPLEDRHFRGGNYCLDFAAGAYSDHGAAAKIALTAAMTVGGWFYFDALGSAENLMGFEGGTGRPWVLSKTAGNYLKLADSGSVAITGSSAAVPHAGRWVHLAVVVESATAATLYLYEPSTGTALVETVTGAGFTSRAAAAGATFRLGYSTNGFAGLMDEVWIYDQALDAETIADIRTRRLTTSEKADAHLVFYCGLEDGTGTTPTDESSSPANGTITGTTHWYPSLTGGDKLAGQVLPNALGPVRDAELLQVELPTQVWQWHSREADAVSAVREGGGEDIALNAAFTDLKTFLAATTPAEKYDTLICSDGSFVRFGSSPSLPVTVHGTGDARGSYVETAGALARRVACGFGPTSARLTDPTDLDTAAFTALDTANSAPVGFFTKEDVTRADVINFLLGSVGARGWFTRNANLFTVQRYEGASGTSVLTLTEANVKDLKPIAAEMPAGTVKVNYERCYRVLTDSELAPGIITDEERNFVTKEWRTVSRASAATIAAYPLAQTVVLDTGFVAEADAVAECERRLTLLSGRGTAYVVEATSVAFQLDRGNIVTLDYQDLDSRGRKQSRLGTGAGLDFVVLAYDEDQERGACQLTVERKD